jgi:hypothetical protein
MKRSLLVFVGLILILTLILSITGCTSSTSTTTTTTTIPNTTSTVTATTTATNTPTVSKLSSIKVTPASPPSLTVGSTQAFTATGTYSDSSTRELFSATWKSDNPSVATISRDGLVTGVAPGKTNITAAQSGITSPPVSLTVIAAPVITTTPGGTTTPAVSQNVYVSVSVDGQLLVVAKPISYTKDMTLEDVIKAAHEAYYSGGKSGYDISTNNAFGMYMVNKCWGIAQVPYIILNDTPNSAGGVFEAVNTVKVKANDNVILCQYTTPTPKSVSLKATISGGKVTVTATDWEFSTSTYTYSHAALKNAKVLDSKGASLGTTDANGQITIDIPADGIVIIEGFAAINVNASATAG